MQKLILIDGHSLAFRGFFGVPIDFDDAVDGIYTNAVRGFFMMLTSLIKNEKPTHIAVAFDTSSDTFRKKDFPQYKAGRSKFPKELSGQFEMIQSLLTSAQISHFNQVGYEADDIIATLAKMGLEANSTISIASGDKDAIQLISSQTTLLFPGARGYSCPNCLTIDKIKEKYGVEPHLYPDLAAIVGERADNLLGVPGVGPKIAAKWLQKYGSLAGIVQNRDTIAGKAGAALRENIDSVLLNRKLNALVDSVPIQSTFDDLKIKTPDFKLLSAEFESKKLGSLFTRFHRVYTRP